MAIKLTAAIAKTAIEPVWDTEVKGLCLWPNAGGSRSFVLFYRADARSRQIKIGNFPTWTVEAARLEAKELRRLIDQGRDPAQEKRERREAPTVADLIERYIADHLSTKSTKPARVRDERQMLAEIGRHLGLDRKAADIHFGDIEVMHRKITESGRPVRANRILAIASKAFSLALRPRAGETAPWRDAARGNPCKGVARNRETARERFFSTAEIAAISDALSEYGTDARGPGIASAQSAADCVRLIMLTGCRPGEAMLATWEQFDNEPGYWVKPSAHTKQRKTHKAPLGPAALELIERLRKRRVPGAIWVFPGQRAGEPLKQLWRVWYFVRDRAKLGPEARLYDLRHSFASIGAGGGLSLPIIGRLLGHTQARTTQRYSHLADDPLREAVEKINTVIAGAGKGGAEIVRIRNKG